MSETLLVAVAGWWWVCRGSVEYLRRVGLVFSDAADSQPAQSVRQGTHWVTECHYQGCYMRIPPPPDMMLHLIPTGLPFFVLWTY